MQWCIARLVDFPAPTRVRAAMAPLRNAVEAALIVAQAARHNRQSRGCHYRQDSVLVEGERLI